MKPFVSTFQGSYYDSDSRHLKANLNYLPIKKLFFILAPHGSDGSDDGDDDMKMCVTVDECESGEKCMEVSMMGGMYCVPGKLSFS